MKKRLHVVLEIIKWNNFLFIELYVSETDDFVKENL